MRVVSKIHNVMRHAKWWTIGAVERAKVGRNLSVAYIHAIPRTRQGDAGCLAFQKLANMVEQAVRPDGFVTLDGENLSEFTNKAGIDANLAVRMNEGEGLDLLQSAGEALSACAMLSLPVRGKARKGRCPDAVEITDFLMKLGFEPVLRDAENGDERFHVLFLRKDILIADCLAPLADWVGAAVDPEFVDEWETNDIPVLVPCFNNQTYCKTMITQLRDRGFDNIILIDNASTSPEMGKFLDEAGKSVDVRRLKENMGPKKCVLHPAIYDSLPRYFCVTDPDIVFSPYLPKDFLRQLISLSREYEIGKVGLALDISHRQFFRDLSIELLHKKWKIWEWEERFWTKPVGVTRSNDRVFSAGVDTTFALYDKDRWTRENFTSALRVTGCFTVTHAPWLAQSVVPADEQARYQQDGVHSYYKM